MALSLGVALYAMSGMIRSPRALSAYTEGLRAYAALVGVETLLLALVAPAMTGAAIAGERERQTLELLLVTRTGAFRIVSRPNSKQQPAQRHEERAEGGEDKANDAKGRPAKFSVHISVPR